MFKKGDKVTRIASWDGKGAVYVRHYIVRSWGKKQGTLIRVDDGSNAEMLIYTNDINTVHGLHSFRIIATADYSEAVAMQFAQEAIDSARALAQARYQRVLELHDNPEYRPYAGSRNQELDRERKVYEHAMAVELKPSIFVPQS